MSNSTRYHVIVIDAEGNETERETRSNKAKAITNAQAINASEKVAVRVQTTAGTVVMEAKAPKSRVITVHTPRWSRVETRVPDLGDGVEIPEDYEVAYVRRRSASLVLRRQGAKGDYLVMDANTGETTPATNTKETAAIMHQRLLALSAS